MSATKIRKGRPNFENLSARDCRYVGNVILLVLMCFLGGERVSAYTCSLVALPPSQDLLLSAKHLFFAARTVWHGPQSSHGERDWRGLQATQSLESAADCHGCSQLRPSADAITATLAPAGRTPTIFGDSGWRHVGAGDAVAPARHPALRAPLAGLFRLRQLLGSLGDGERRQQHSRNDQRFQHGECPQLGHTFVTTLARLRAISTAVLTASSRLSV